MEREARRGSQRKLAAWGVSLSVAVVIRSIMQKDAYQIDLVKRGQTR